MEHLIIRGNKGNIANAVKDLKGRFETQDLTIRTNPSVLQSSETIAMDIFIQNNNLSVICEEVQFLRAKHQACKFHLVGFPQIKVTTKIATTKELDAFEDLEHYERRLDND